MSKHTNPYAYAEKPKPDKFRAHQLSSKVVDLTHDTLPEYNWKPIKKAYDRVPPAPTMDDKVLLREWEQEQLMEYYKNVYDRRNIDIDVFKKFQANGEIIKMTINASELTKDKNFWKTESEIQEKAVQFINQMKNLKPYDVHKLQP